MFKGLTESLQNFHFLEIIVTIVIFFLGLLFNKISESLKEKRRLKILREYLFELLYLIKAQSENQSKYILECSKKLKDSHRQNLTLDRVSGRYIDNLKKLDHKDIFTILVRRKKGKIKIKSKRFEELLSTIDFFNDVYSYIFKYNEQIIDNYIENKNEWNKNIGLFRDRYQEIVHEMTQPPFSIKKDRFIQVIANILEKNKDLSERNDPNIGIKTYYENIFAPIIKHLYTYPDDPRTNKLLQPLLNAEYYFNETETQRYHYRRHILLTGREMIKYSKKLSKLIEVFKQKRIKK